MKMVPITGPMTKTIHYLLQLSEFKKNIFLPLLILSLFFLQWGCKQNELEEKKSPQESLNNIPSVPEVDAIMSSILALERDLKKRRELEINHTDWLKLRGNYCSSQAANNTDKGENQTDLARCNEAFDRQRIQLLNQKKIDQLFKVAPPEKSPLIETTLSYSLEAIKDSYVPFALQVASSAPVAAITFKNGFIEIVDLVNGQQLSKITPLDEKEKPIRDTFDSFLTPNGRILITSTCAAHKSKGWMRIWETRTGRLLREELVSLYPRISTSQARYFICTQGSKVGVFDIITGNTIWSPEGKEHIYSVAISPDDRRLLVIREHQLESWDLSLADDDNISLSMNTQEIIGNYNEQPISIVFSSDSKSFYSSLPKEAVVIQRQLPDLKTLRRLKFPALKRIKLSQNVKGDSFLIEATSSSNTLEAYSADMVKETAQRLLEYKDSRSKMSSLGNNQVLFATSRGLTISQLPDATSYLPFSQTFGGSIAEPVVPSFSTSEEPKAECKNFRLESIGIYEGQRLENETRAFSGKNPGIVNVAIGSTILPTKLVLSSYEPVIWQLDVSEYAQISEVFLVGSNASRIEGALKAPVNFLGNVYAYEENNSANLTGLVKQRTGCSIQNSQYSYTGSHFSIGENPAYHGSGKGSGKDWRQSPGNKLILPGSNNAAVHVRPQGDVVPIEDWKVTLVTARAVPKLGEVHDITDTFTFEGRLFAHATLTAPPGSHCDETTFELKWYSGDRLIVIHKAKYVVSKSPYYLSASTSPTTLGAGIARVEVIADGKLLAGKRFRVREK